MTDTFYGKKHKQRSGRIMFPVYVLDSSVAYPKITNDTPTLPSVFDTMKHPFCWGSNISPCLSSYNLALSILSFCIDDNWEDIPMSVIQRFENDVILGIKNNKDVLPDEFYMPVYIVHEWLMKLGLESQNG